jgi:hypothetical protein
MYQSNPATGPNIIEENNIKYTVYTTTSAKIWTKDGNIHRELGPAVERLDGQHQWWYEGFFIFSCKSQQEFEKLIKLKAFW